LRLTTSAIYLTFKSPAQDFVTFDFNDFTTTSTPNSSDAQYLFCTAHISKTTANMALSLIETPQTPRTAAAEVFGLPELLENILLHIPFVEDNSVIRAHMMNMVDQLFKVDGRFPDPSKELFILQRVNSTFSATISRNKTLQRRMFLAANPAGSGEVNLHNPIRWLVEVIGVCRGGYELTMFDDKESLDVHIHSREKRRSSREKQATWRKMKLHCTDNRAPVVVQFCGFESITALAEFGYGDNMTLGRLHDGLEKLVPFIADFNQDEERMIDNNGKFRSLWEHSLKRLEHECTREDLWQ
jgi:hypothetical protein